jgi:4'-phosphopantetheinyl transferase
VGEREPRIGASQCDLASSTADVIACRLDVTAEERDALREYLSVDESARADRYRFARDRDRFVVARGRLRQLLGALSHRAPSDVRFAVAAGGKPWLAGDAAGRLRFSVSHSGDLMLCAVTLDHEIGVDVEQVRTSLDPEALARRFFSTHEVSSLAATPSGIALDAFFACWTRKEAVIKATGEGLSRPLDSFSVSVDPGRAALLSADPSMGRPREWSLISVPLPPQYHGAVAVRAAVSLRLWWWPVPWFS